ncbi:MAG: polysaccharide pyruvyl transferase family protein, partial [Sulfurimonas sp.]
MFVKILTMHRIINYGSFLQAYALMKIIESYGHNVEFCDFVAGEARHNGSKVQPPSLFDRLKEASLAPFTHLKKRKFFKETKKCFHNIAWKELKLTKENNLSYTCDCLVVGSDEVFNYTQHHGFGYVPQFFGHGLDASSIFAFAASAGYANIKDIENDNMENEIGSGLNKFSSISVRDENTYDIVEKYSRHKPSQVIDPTLLYDFELETNAKHKKFNKKRYLIIYAYTGRLDTKKDIKVIKEYTKKNNLTTISLGFFHGWCDHNLVVTPFELLSLFKDAEAVLTDTFHGSIFSIKFSMKCLHFFDLFYL